MKRSKKIILAIVAALLVWALLLPVLDWHTWEIWRRPGEAWRNMLPEPELSADESIQLVTTVFDSYLNRNGSQNPPKIERIAINPENLPLDGESKARLAEHYKEAFGAEVIWATYDELVEQGFRSNGGYLTVTLLSFDAPPRGIGNTVYVSSSGTVEGYTHKLHHNGERWEITKMITGWIT